MSLIDQIASIMLQQGNINGQRERERIAMEEEQRQAKHRTLKNILKFAAEVAPYFIPGVGPIAGPAISAGIHAGGNYLSSDPEFLDPSQNPNIGVWHR